MNKKFLHDQIADNLYEFYKQAALHNNLKVIRKKYFFIVNNPHSDWPQYVLCDKVNQENYKDATLQLNQMIETGEAPPLVLFPVDENYPEMADYPESFGLRSINRWEGMAIIMDEYLPEKEDKRIIRVKTLEQVTAWTEVINHALFTGRKAEVEIMLNLMQNPGIQLFLALEKNIPVATSMVFLHKEVAGLYFIATLEEYRKKGLGSALTKAALNEAKKEKCKAAVLHATRLGEKIYRKLGFIPYRKFYIYWKLGKQYM
ncbi:MAG: GNAT family N-acetyltransferase [Bacteroidales bacterium]